MSEKQVFTEKKVKSFKNQDIAIRIVLKHTKLIIIVVKLLFLIAISKIYI